MWFIAILAGKLPRPHRRPPLARLNSLMIIPNLSLKITNTVFAQDRLGWRLNRGWYNPCDSPCVLFS